MQHLSCLNIVSKYHQIYICFEFRKKVTSVYTHWILWKRTCEFTRIIYSMNNKLTAWKVSALGVFVVRIFPHADWIRRDIPHLPVFGLNAGKYGPEELQIQTLHIVTGFCFPLSSTYFLDDLVYIYTVNFIEKVEVGPTGSMFGIEVGIFKTS